MRVIHIQTTINTTFGFLDDAGNVVEMRQASGQIQRLACEDFEQVLSDLLDAKAKLEQEQCPSPSA